MKWSGETQAQRLRRWMKPHKRYAYFPRQMDCGTWVWLDYYWARLEAVNTRQFFYKWQLGLTEESVQAFTIKVPVYKPNPLSAMIDPDK